jgi:hypothetical protein
LTRRANNKAIHAIARPGLQKSNAMTLHILEFGRRSARITVYNDTHRPSRENVYTLT